MAKACEGVASPCTPRSERPHEGDEITPYACEGAESVTAPGCLGFMIGNGRCLEVKCLACVRDCCHAGYTFLCGVDMQCTKQV